MRKNIAIVTTLCLMSISGLMSVHAYTPYYNNYSTGTRSNSYTYVQGCYIYSYDAYTRITSLIGSTCSTANTNSYNYNNYNSMYYPTYSSNTYPTYSSNTYTYSVPATTYSYYTQPTTYTSYSPYYTYGYNDGYWSRGVYTGFFNDNNGYIPTPTTGCYYVNGYYTCY